MGPCLSQRAYSYYDDCDHGEQKGRRHAGSGEGRTAKSHLNFNDGEEEQYMNCDEDFGQMSGEEVGAGGFLELGRRQKSLRVSFADSDIKRPDQCRPRLRRNFDQVSMQVDFNDRQIQGLLRTPGAADAEEQDLAHEFDVDKFEIDVDMGKKAAQHQAKKVAEEEQDTPSSIDRSLYTYFMTQQDLDEPYLPSYPVQFSQLRGGDNLGDDT